MSRTDAGLHGRGRGFLPALALLLFTVLGTVMVGLSPRAGQTRFAVFVAPGQDLLSTVEMVGASGGFVLATGAIPNLVFAHSDAPGFVDSLYRAGAWLVLDGASPGGCFGPRAARSAGPAV